MREINHHPKIIQKWKNRFYGSKNYIYKYPNGLRVALAVHNATVDFAMSIVIKGGSSFERSVGVPQGTAHFLEHILAGNPNKYLTSINALDEYEFGNKKRPAIFTNASTSARCLYFYGSANENGMERIVDSLMYKIDFPIETISKYIEKERKIIIAELKRLDKEEKDEALLSRRFIIGDIAPEFAERIIGTEESINSITIEDLVKYYNNVFTTDNIVISAQCSENIHKQVINYISKYQNVLSNNKSTLVINDVNLENKSRFGIFHDEKSNGVSLSIFSLEHKEKEWDYRRNVLDFIESGLIWKLGKDILREKKGIVYSINKVDVPIHWGWAVRGFKFTVEFSNFEEALEECYRLIQSYWSDFLATSHGKKWFADRISSYIFPRTQAYNVDYAESLAVNELFDVPYFDFAKEIKAAKSITINDLINRMEEHAKIPHHMWISSHVENEKISKIVENSSLYRMYS